MKKIATLLFVPMLFASGFVFAQIKTETTVKLEWHEQSFIHFYAPGYDVFVSKPEFMNFDNELLAGLFDEFADKNDSIDLTNPFPYFKTEQKNLLWKQLMTCTSEGNLLILPSDSKKKLKSVIIVRDTESAGMPGTWECRDPRTNQLIFAYNKTSIGSNSSANNTTGSGKFFNAPKQPFTD